MWFGVEVSTRPLLDKQSVVQHSDAIERKWCFRLRLSFLGFTRRLLCWEIGETICPWEFWWCVLEWDSARKRAVWCRSFYLAFAGQTERLFSVLMLTLASNMQRHRVANRNGPLLDKQASFIRSCCTLSSFSNVPRPCHLGYIRWCVFDCWIRIMTNRQVQRSTKYFQYSSCACMVSLPS